MPGFVVCLAEGAQARREVLQTARRDEKRLRTPDALCVADVPPERVADAEPERANADLNSLNVLCISFKLSL